MTGVFDRLMARVNKTETCWNWTAAKNRKGYGQIRIKGRLWIAHRLSYTLAKSEIPEGFHVLHSCDNPSCVNPDHLSIGTNQDNVDDKMAKRRHWVFRKTHCKSGHELTEENTRIRKDGARCCRTCERALCKSYHQRIRKWRHLASAS